MQGVKSTNQYPYYLFVIAGVAGGIAEIAWMYIYSINNQLTLKDIANEISATLNIHTSNYLIGLCIHMTLSALIGIGYGKLIFQRMSKHNISLVALGAMLLVFSIWLVNFKVILPMVNIQMKNIVPEYISLISKMLFGAGMTITYAIFVRKK